MESLASRLLRNPREASLSEIYRRISRGVCRRLQPDIKRSSLFPTMTVSDHPGFRPSMPRQGDTSDWTQDRVVKTDVGGHCLSTNRRKQAKETEFLGFDLQVSCRRTAEADRLRAPLFSSMCIKRSYLRKCNATLSGSGRRCRNEGIIPCNRHV